MTSPPLRLTGRRIALPEHRELDRLAALLETEGARTVRCPLMAILEAPDPQPIVAWLRLLAGGFFHDLVLLTGEGVDRLVTAAEKAGMRAEVLSALAQVRKFTRGPKPARALHALGLAADVPARAPTSEGVMEALRAFPLGGRRVGVQLFGDDPSAAIVALLEQKGALAVPVAPYRYAPASDDQEVADAIAEMSRGSIDAIAFTTAMQVQRLFQVARKESLEPVLRKGLGRMFVAAVGPIVDACLRQHGVRVDCVPDKQFFMRRLTQAMAEGLGPRVPRRGRASYAEFTLPTRSSKPESR